MIEIQLSNQEINISLKRVTLGSTLYFIDLKSLDGCNIILYLNYKQIDQLRKALMP